MSGSATERIPQPHGGALQPWRKGQSGNSNGRPGGAPGLAKYIRDHSLEGREVADFLLRVLRCEKTSLDKCKVTMDHRMEAARILLNRGFGRAVETMVIGGSSSLSDIIARAYQRRQVDAGEGEGERIKDAQVTVVEGEGGRVDAGEGPKVIDAVSAPAGEAAQESAGEEGEGKKNLSRDSKGENRNRGAGGPS